MSSSEDITFAGSHLGRLVQMSTCMWVVLTVGRGANDEQRHLMAEMEVMMIVVIIDYD